MDNLKNDGNTSRLSDEQLDAQVKVLLGGYYPPFRAVRCAVYEDTGIERVLECESPEMAKVVANALTQVAIVSGLCKCPQEAPQLDAVARLAAFWEQLRREFDIEPREFFEIKAPESGTWTPEQMAVHHMWKRDPKVQELEKKLAAAEAKAEQYANDWHAHKHETGVTIGNQAKRIADLEQQLAAAREHADEAEKADRGGCAG